MAEDILSQEEVDALLRGVSGEAEPAAVETPAAGGVQPYDIGRQERPVRDRTLLELHDTAANVGIVYPDAYAMDMGCDGPRIRWFRGQY